MAGWVRAGEQSLTCMCCTACATTYAQGLQDIYRARMQQCTCQLTQTQLCTSGRTHRAAFAGVHSRPDTQHQNSVASRTTLSGVVHARPAEVWLGDAVASSPSSTHHQHHLPHSISANLCGTFPQRGCESKRRTPRSLQQYKSLVLGHCCHVSFPQRFLMGGSFSSLAACAPRSGSVPKCTCCAISGAVSAACPLARLRTFPAA